MQALLTQGQGLSRFLQGTWTMQCVGEVQILVDRWKHTQGLPTLESVSYVPFPLLNPSR